MYSSNHFITNFPQNMPVKNFENRSIFSKDMDKNLQLTFLAHPVCLPVTTKTFIRSKYVMLRRMNSMYTTNYYSTLLSATFRSPSETSHIYRSRPTVILVVYIGCKQASKQERLQCPKQLESLRRHCTITGVGNVKQVSFKPDVCVTVSSKPSFIEIHSGTF